VTRFLFNLALGLVWCALTGSITEWNFIAGTLVGAVIISVYAGATGGRPYIGRGWRLLRCLLHFSRLLVQSNLIVAWEVLTPRMHLKPRIIRYAVDDMSDAHRTALASAITLTPGTLSVDLSPDGRWLYIHCMYGRDRERTVRDLDDLAATVRRALFS